MKGDTMPDVTIVIPVYNEIATIDQVLERVLAASLLPGRELTREVIVVDDGSTDGTRERLQVWKDRVTVLCMDQNRGKGFALRQGFAAANGTVVLIQDADLEYSPGDYPRLLAPFFEHQADVVYGSRFSGGETRRVLYFWHMVINTFITLLTNMFSNLNLTDVETCYKAIRRVHLQKLKLHEDRFGIEIELTIKLARLGIRFFEVSVSYDGRTYEEGKKIGWRDAVRAVWCIFKYGLAG